MAAEGVGQDVIARLRSALLIAEHGLTTSHGLMAYDDGTPAGAKQHFRLDNTEELAAIKAALKGKP